MKYTLKIFFDYSPSHTIISMELQAPNYQEAYKIGEIVTPRMGGLWFDIVEEEQK